MQWLAMILTFSALLLTATSLAIHSCSSYYLASHVAPYLTRMGVTLESPHIKDMMGVLIFTIVGQVFSLFYRLFRMTICVLHDWDVAELFRQRSTPFTLLELALVGCYLYLTWAFWTLAGELEALGGAQYAGVVRAIAIYLISVLSLAGFILVSGIAISGMGLCVSIISEAAPVAPGQQAGDHELADSPPRA